ncbi:MAG: asparagine synthase (glutamine-hydrolyzing) [Nitrospirae bacterium]|nr:asparagine synthase (glutamine-hydrolyzing) [Nitrospirota bacterium]
MCGICGKINLDGQPVSERLIKSMNSAIVHRGPDDEGGVIKGPVGLGHRRLSIIDLSDSARQPMCNEDGTIWIVFNGEIYNFQELSRDLLSKGHEFRTKSDTEAIIHLYEEYGAECLKYLRGMFAFAIFDEKRDELFLARDRVGKKPLYYYHTDKTFIFASEIKAILQDNSIQRTPDLEGINHYLTYLYVPSPWSAFKGIKKLPPAHYMILKDGKIKTERYWKLSYLPKHQISFESLKKEIINRLREAVKIRLISDVPLGAFLSGGVDSSAIVALMSQLMREPVKTFSIGFKEEAYNELRYARMVAERFKTDHTEFMVEPKAVDLLPKLVWHYNEPYADVSAIPTYYVSKLAREHVTVILNGDGGDENFAGYGRYVANEYSALMHRFLPAALVNMTLPLLNNIPHGHHPRGFIWRLKRFLKEYVKPSEVRNGHWISQFTTEMKSELCTDDFIESVFHADSLDLLLDKYKEAEAETFLDKTLYADVAMYLPEDLLVKVDIASMANSLECRSPFLDQEFMEFAAMIPSEYKLKGRSTKHILKESLRGILPDEVMFREKMGFGVPLDYWFRNELKDMAYDTLLGRQCVERGYFHKEYIQRILDEHVSGKWNWQNHIWSLLMLELWHQTFIDGYA